MDKLASLSIVVPFHDEEENIEDTVERIHATFPAFAIDYEVILVDDGSRDRTGELADRIAEDDPRVRVVHHPENLGYGAALRSGFAACRNDHIFYTDGDLQFDLNDFTRLRPLIDTVDIVSGYRGDRKDPWHRRVNGRIFNLIMGLLFGLWFRDIDCAFKLYRRRVFELVKPRSDSILIDAEIYILARRKGMTIREVEVTHHPRIRGTNVGNSPRIVINAILELVAFIVRMLFTRPAAIPAVVLAMLPFSGHAGENPLVDVTAEIPGLDLDIRYHGSYNFVGRPIDGYEAAKCLLTPEAVRALAKVQEDLSSQDLTIKVYDCYRPQRAVDHFVRWAQDSNDVTMKPIFYPEVPKDRLFEKGYIARRSGHSRGSTVDLTLVPEELAHMGQCSEAERHCIDFGLDMGSPYDFFDPVSHALSTEVTEAQRANRMLLREAMTKHGFKPYEEEWWHFTLTDEPYPETYFDFPVE